MLFRLLKVFTGRKGYFYFRIYFYTYFLFTRPIYVLNNIIIDKLLKASYKLEFTQEICSRYLNWKLIYCK